VGVRQLDELLQVGHVERYGYAQAVHREQSGSMIDAICASVGSGADSASFSSGNVARFRT
jgi:hypothetical protein